MKRSVAGVSSTLGGLHFTTFAVLPPSDPCSPTPLSNAYAVSISQSDGGLTLGCLWIGHKYCSILAQSLWTRPLYHQYGLSRIELGFLPHCVSHPYICWMLTIDLLWRHRMLVLLAQRVWLFQVALQALPMPLSVLFQ